MLPEDVNRHAYALTIPATASIESVALFQLNIRSGAVVSCASWQDLRAIPATQSCESEAGRISYSIQPYSEPANPAIKRDRAEVPPALLEAAQGFRFTCSGQANDSNACRIQIRWKPKP